MASATTMQPLQAGDISNLSINDSLHLTSPSPVDTMAVSEGDVSKWTNLIRTNMTIAHQINKDLDDDASEDSQSLKRLLIDEAIMDSPRRRSTRDALAKAVAARLYPSSTDSLSSVIQYEKDIVFLRRLVLEQRRNAIAEAAKHKAQYNWMRRIQKQGPWDEMTDPLSMKGAPSLPMPVDVSSKESLAPFFAHLHSGGDTTPSAALVGGASTGAEPYYDVELVEFQKGVLYADGRVDLCKMVTGPRNIGDLMESLKPNTFSKHFLLGNNIIGPTGAAAIADFIDEYPDRFVTWYLAGNCIDTASFRLLVGAITQSPVVTNVWVKRNPLMPAAAQDVVRLITQALSLRTLDLDQTELGDKGVSELFSQLADHVPETPLALRNIYLNACGIGLEACDQIARYLASPHCTLTSLYMSNNPIGSAISALGKGMKANKTLERLSLQSCGLTGESTANFILALSNHSSLRMLDVGQGYSTEDLSMRYNWLTDASAPAIVRLIETTKLQYLNLGYMPISQPGLNDIMTAASKSTSLLWFQAKPLYKGARDAVSVHLGQRGAKLKNDVRERLHLNVKTRFGGMDYETFEAQEKRFLVSPRDVRLIDSVYRNRDAAAARRGLKHLDKWWGEGDETLERIQDGTFV